MGSFKRYVIEGREGSKLCYEPLRKFDGGEEVSVIALSNADKILYMVNFTRNLL